MTKQELEKIINYIIKHGLDAIKDNTKETVVSLDYVAICAKDKNEFNQLMAVIQPLGQEIDANTTKTGHTFLLKEPIKTSAGQYQLRLVKIRKPDPTRPQRGAPDFKVKNYQQFKKKYLQSSGNFTLMVRKDYEMVEIKGVDVLVYIPDKPLTERIKLTSCNFV